MTAHPKPTAEVSIDEPLVRRLLEEQHPELAGSRIRLMTSGWDNAIFHLGVDLLMRLPRRQLAADLIGNEQRWLPELASRLPIPIPVPRYAGRPSDAFRWAWSVVDLIPGVDGLDESPAPAEAVAVLASFVNAMHVVAPVDAPSNSFRGVPLRNREEQTRSELVGFTAAFPEGPDVGLLEEIWERALEAPTHEGPPVWLHGDLHPGNVIVRDQTIASVIDFGDLTSGDPATDIGAAWMFFESADRERFRSLVGADGPTWARARGWALSVSLGIALNSSDNPRYEALGLRTLQRVIDDLA